MSGRHFGRREFIGGAAAMAGGAMLSREVLRGAEAGPPPAPKTAVDQVTLGKCGVKLCRLGVGTGSRGASVQRALGKETFVKMLHHAFAQGVTYIDTADNYKTHEWVGAAIRGRDREKLYLLSKVWGVPQDPAKDLDRFRRELGTDYIDTVLLHCATTPKWVEERKKVVDTLIEAREKKQIRSIGVSCHTMAALNRTPDLDWLDMVLVRINPQNVAMDTSPRRRKRGAKPQPKPKTGPEAIRPVVDAVKKLRAKGRGIIGMKIIGNGTFTKPEDREKSIRYAMGCGLLDAVTIGFKNTDEIDEAITRMNNALAAGPGTRTRT